MCTKRILIYRNNVWCLRHQSSSLSCWNHHHLSIMWWSVKIQCKHWRIKSQSHRSYGPWSLQKYTLSDFIVTFSVIILIARAMSLSMTTFWFHCNLFSVTIVTLCDVIINEHILVKMYLSLWRLLLHLQYHWQCTHSDYTVDTLTSFHWSADLEPLSDQHHSLTNPVQKRKWYRQKMTFMIKKKWGKILIDFQQCLNNQFIK